MHMAATAVLPAFPFQHGGGLAGNPRARRAERMADGDSAAVQVHLVRIDAQFMDAGQRLGRESFV